MTDGVSGSNPGQTFTTNTSFSKVPGGDALNKITGKLKICLDSATRGVNCLM